MHIGSVTIILTRDILQWKKSHEIYQHVTVIDRKIYLAYYISFFVYRFWERSKNIIFETILLERAVGIKKVRQS